jgi:hypothetical protein
LAVGQIHQAAQIATSDGNSAILEAKRSRVARISFALILVAVAANLAFNLIASWLGYGFPYSSFLFKAEDRFADFFKLAFSYPGLPVHASADAWGLNAHFADFRAQIAAAEGTGLNHFHVPPLETLLAVMVRRSMAYADPVLIFAVACASSLFMLFKTVSRRSNSILGVTTLFAYPTLMALDRGHLFSLLCAICLIAGTCRAFERERSSFATILLFAVALNVRPNAVVIPVGLWLTRRLTFREMAMLGIMGASIFFVSLAAANFLYPAYSLEAFRLGLLDYNRAYVMGHAGLAYGSSLYGALAMLFANNQLTFLLPIEFAVFLLCASAWLRWKSRLSGSSFIFLVISAYALGSQVFADYHLLIFFVPLIMIVHKSKLDWDDRIIMIASIFVLAPKNYVFFFDFHWQWSLQVVLNPLGLILSSLIIIGRALWRQTAQVPIAEAQPDMTRA